MGKDGGLLTPKAIAKKIKAAGLQKLKFYCQMCQKQCRDANGFKCHTESEAHQRNMLLFAESGKKIMDQFSREFEGGFLDIVRRSYNQKRVHANVVYNEYIKDRNHIHMNATRWVTLTSFVLYLGKSGKCKVEETPKGWYITYIERDPELLARQEKLAKKEKQDQDDEQRIQKAIEDRVKKTQADARESEVSEVKPEDLQATKFEFVWRKGNQTSKYDSKETKQEEPEIETIDYDGPLEEETTEGERIEPNLDDILLQMNEKSMKLESLADENKLSTTTPISSSTDGQVKETKGETERSSSSASVTEIKNQVSQGNSSSVPEKKREHVAEIIPSDSSSTSQVKSKWDEHFAEEPKKKEVVMKKRKMSALEEIMMNQEKTKEMRRRTEWWIAEGLIVKVMNKKLADGKYYKEKGVIEKVVDKFVGVIKMLQSGDILKLDQSQLETVIPNIGGKVRIVNGAYRDEVGSLISVNVDKFTASVRIETGPQTQTVMDFPYEDICKFER